MRVVSTFAPSRGWLVGATAGGATGAAARDRRHWDALYVMANNGSLIEYHVEPRPASGRSGGDAALWPGPSVWH